MKWRSPCRVAQYPVSARVYEAAHDCDNCRTAIAPSQSGFAHELAQSPGAVRHIEQTDQAGVAILAAVSGSTGYAPSGVTRNRT
jgi:hypothetical protein